MALPEGINFDVKPKVGSFGTKVINQLRKNPRDKCTIVSIYPREINDFKPTLFPGRFVIPAAPENDFSILVVEGSSYYLASRLENQPPTEVQVGSVELAESIIKDSIPSMNLVSANSRPGVFYIIGAYDRNNIRNYVDDDINSPTYGKKFDEFLADAKIQQSRYFTAVIDEADYFWSASQGNPKTIPADAKLAAKLLGLDKVKPWMSNVVASNLEPCPYCGEMINLNFPICKYCHNTVNKTKASELDQLFKELK